MTAAPGHAGCVPSLVGCAAGGRGAGREKPSCTASPAAHRQSALQLQLGGAEHRDRHQLKPGDEALEVASCHPRGDAASEGEAPAAVALGTAGAGEAENGQHKWVGRHRAWQGQQPRHSLPPPPPLLLAFHSPSPPLSLYLPARLCPRHPKLPSRSLPFLTQPRQVLALSRHQPSSPPALCRARLLSLTCRGCKAPHRMVQDLLQVHRLTRQGHFPLKQPSQQAHVASTHYLIKRKLSTWERSLETKPRVQPPGCRMPWQGSRCPAWAAAPGWDVQPLLQCCLSHQNTSIATDIKIYVFFEK